MKVIGIIPARYKSSRFPGKPLVSINGVPLVIRVCRLASEALGLQNVYVATEDQRIVDLVNEYGYQSILTSDEHLTGTDRLSEVASKITADIYINIQGDEPMVNPQDILNIVEEKKKFPNYVINGVTRILDVEDPHSVNIPKVLMNKNNDLIYMSRLAIPGIKGTSEKPMYLKQVCIYAFTKDELLKFGEQKFKAEFEKFEDIEILRFLDLGVKVKMVYTDHNSLAVDIPEDVYKVEDALKKVEC